MTSKPTHFLYVVDICIINVYLLCKLLGCRFWHALLYLVLTTIWIASNSFLLDYTFLILFFVEWFSQMITISCHVAHWYLVELWLFHVLMLWLSSSTLQENARLEVRRGTLLHVFTMSQNLWLVISMQYWYKFKFASLVAPWRCIQLVFTIFPSSSRCYLGEVKPMLDSYCLLLIPFSIKSIIVWIYWHHECPISLYYIPT
jgi:hypothetical protein